MLELSEPRTIERRPYNVVGVYCEYEGDDEGPGWSGAHKEFFRRVDEIPNRADDQVLGFLYRPHRDHPEISEDVTSCFIGAEVCDLDHVPEGMVTTTFPGGLYVIVACRGDTPGEAAQGVGEAIGMLEGWIEEQGCVEGDACFACSPVQKEGGPYIEYVYVKMDEKSG